MIAEAAAVNWPEAAIWIAVILAIAWVLTHD